MTEWSLSNLNKPQSFGEGISLCQNNASTVELTALFSVCNEKGLVLKSTIWSALTRKGKLHFGLRLVTTVLWVLITIVTKTPKFYFVCVFWARICWQVVQRWHEHMCYKRNLDRYRKMHPSEVLKMNPVFSLFPFMKPEHKWDASAWWCLSRAFPKGLTALSTLFLGLVFRREREGGEKKVVFVLSSEHLLSLREAASLISAFRAPGIFANQA